MKNVFSGLLPLVAALTLAASAQAGERSGSTYVPGTLGDFGIGLVATNPGLYARTDLFAYQGTDAQSVRYGRVNLDLEMAAWVASLKLTAVPGWTFLGGRYAAGLNAGLVNAHVASDVRTQAPDGSTILTRQTGDRTALADFYATPLALGWTLGDVHLAWIEMVTVPSGTYNGSEFVNVSRNYWALDSQLAATWRHPVYGQEVSCKTGYILNDWNHDTDYRSGQEFHADGILAQHLGRGLSLGAAWYFYHQVTGDQGSGAMLGEFKGEAFGAGPILRTVIPVGSSYIALIGKWLHEFYTHGRFQGDYIFLWLATRL